ncbi:calcium-binding protein [Jiella pelagia]|uniref:Calcium-binding protein n=1 Tax=Jiella pelagia TaxID=2986949 RepID=A0ABY7BYN9_9HYPH|nr:calcium-binding protein [Jiella pelagia]WAP68664.1 calcium-binding protein [Jiella pelagia]
MLIWDATDTTSAFRNIDPNNNFTDYGGGSDPWLGDDEIYGNAGNNRGSTADPVSGRYSGLQGYGGSDEIHGRGGDDYLYGHSYLASGDTAADGGDRLFGGDGNDHLYGQGGDDYLDGGSGNNYINGGAGIDTFSYLHATVGTKILLDMGTASVGWLNVDQLVSIENVVGSNWRDYIRGTDDDNRIRGGGNDDRIFGGGGSDTAVFQGDMRYYDVRIIQSGITITDNRPQAQIDLDATDIAFRHSDGTDELFDVEFLEFKDGIYSVEDLLPEQPDAEYSAIYGPLTGSLPQYGLSPDWFDPSIGFASDVYYSSTGIYIGSEFYGLGGQWEDYTRYKGEFDIRKDVDTGNYYLAAGTIDSIEHRYYYWNRGEGSIYDESWRVSGTALTAAEVRDLSSGDLAARMFAGNDTLNGSHEGDTMGGYAGNDVLYGLGGADYLAGGDGDDLLYGDEDDDTLAGGAGADRMSGGTGIDGASYFSSSSGVTVSLATGVGSGGDAEGDFLLKIENLEGSQFADIFTGDDGANSLRGRNGNDLLIGGGGADSIFGDGGADRIAGGAGADIIFGGIGNDLIVGGADGDTIQGDAGNDRFVADADGANDTYDGGVDIDTMDYSTMTAGLTINLVTGTATSAQIGTDTLVSIERIFGGSSNDAILGNATTLLLSGNGGGDILTGGSGNNVIFGGLGDDRLRGLGGNDILIGGLDEDDLDGGAGNDTFLADADAANDSYHGGADIDTMDFAAMTAGLTVNLVTGTATSSQIGADKLVSVERILGGSSNDAILGNATTLLLSGNGGGDILTGGSGNNVIFGGLGDDRLRGLGGNDILIGGLDEDDLDGGAGNDTFLADADGANDRYDGGANIDTMDFSAMTAGLTVNLVVQTATSTQIGSDSLESIERVLGGEGNDAIFGNANTVFLSGNGGADILTGGTGNNSLFGGLGNDILRGMGGNDFLNGAVGDDRLEGGAGNDIFVFGNGFGDDVVTDFDEFSAAEKIDLSAVTGITSFVDLQANHLSQVGANAVITDGVNTITLNNVLIGNLDAGDFIF